MPNHFHLVVQPATEATLSPFMQWWMTSHVRRYHKHYRSHGHVWQGRFKSFPIQQDGHLLTALRYVLRNPVRAGLVEHAMDWPWSSLRLPHLRDPLPIETPIEWFQGIDQPLFAQELTMLRTCVNRQDDRLASNHRSHAWPLVHAPKTRASPETTRKVACPLFVPIGQKKTPDPFSFPRLIRSVYRFDLKCKVKQ